MLQRPRIGKESMNRLKVADSALIFKFDGPFYVYLIKDGRMTFLRHSTGLLCFKDSNTAQRAIRRVRPDIEIKEKLQDLYGHESVCFVENEKRKSA